jgi:Tfp pilus assembly protein PilN
MNLFPDQDNQNPLPDEAGQKTGGDSSSLVNAPSSNGDTSDTAGGFGGLKVSLMPSGEEEEGVSVRKWLIVLLAALLVETVAIGAGYLYMTNREAVLKERRTELEQAIELNDQNIASAEKIAVQASNFGKKAREAGDILDGHLIWTRFFQHVSRVTKPTVTYLNFSGDYASRTVAMDAVARTYRDVAEQIVALREDEAISKVITSSASARVNEVGEVEGVGFSLVLTVDEYLWQVNQPENNQSVE